jgi:hypothetical protein
LISSANMISSQYIDAKDETLKHGGASMEQINESINKISNLFQKTREELDSERHLKEALQAELDALQESTEALQVNECVYSCIFLSENVCPHTHTDTHTHNLL